MVKSILFVCAGLLLAINVPAQQLPPLPVDSSIETGTLGCGAAYYIVKAPVKKGYASIALVQKDDSLTVEKRKDLSAEFLSRMGVGPTERGYLSESDGSTIYRFSDIPFYRKEVMDSMLLYTFSKMAQSTAPQAIVVSGDVEPAAELKKKMNIFSMLVQKLDKPSARKKYEWNPDRFAVVDYRKGPGSVITVTYAGNRVPDVFMNTAQAIVTDIFGAELVALMRHRLEKDLAAAGIIYSDISFSSIRSNEQSGDERYSVSVKVAPESQEQALRVIARTIASLDSKGVPVQEFSDAKEVILPDFLKAAHSTSDNVDRCIAHFLFGANLAPASERVRLFARKNLSDENQARIFNKFASALLSGENNLTLDLAARDSMDVAESFFLYNLSYKNALAVPSEADYTWHRADSAGMEYTPARVRIQKERLENASGATSWTFSNGIRVVFKQVKGSGMFSYAWVLNGGLNQIPGLKEGEAGHIAPMLSLYNVAGLPAPVFRDLLQVNGLTLDADVWLNNLVLSGNAPSGKFIFMLKTLLSLASERELNQEEFARYSATDALRELSAQDIIHKELYPGFRYSTVKGAITESTQKKADSYFADRFARFNDGVLIISGDLDPANVKRVLTRYLGGFGVQKSALPRRNVEFKPRSGAVTITGEAGPNGVHVVLGAPLSVTSDNYYTSLVASQALSTALTKSLIPYGFKAYVNINPMTQPQERFSVEITCVPVPECALPVSVGEPDVTRAITAVRSAISESARTAPSQTDVTAWKKMVLESVSANMATAQGFTASQEVRYALNKDLISRFTESINAVTPEKVRSFISTVSSGATVEYISK